MLAVLLLALLPQAQSVTDAPRLADAQDRSAFRSWFVVLADAQFYRPTPDVTDCSSFVRHAVREALRPHSPDWWRRFGVPSLPSYPDVTRPPRAERGAWPIFKVADGKYAEFADARTIVRYNARFVSRAASAARPGDLLYFHQPESEGTDHLMIFIGPSVFDRAADDWVVYHTGPDGSNSGESRKVRLSDLRAHPAPRWRPVAGNPRFVGIFRLSFL